MSYRDDALSDAKDTIENFKDEIVEQLLEKGEASDDLYNDYPNGDSYHHESHLDRSYRLTEAAEVLDELHEFEETDSGLWEGLEPRAAIEVQAAYTYAACVYSIFRELVKDINGDEGVHLCCEMVDELEALEEDDPERIKEILGAFHEGEATTKAARANVERGLGACIKRILEDA